MMKGKTKIRGSKAQIANTMYGADFARKSCHGNNVEGVAKSTPIAFPCGPGVTLFVVSSNQEKLNYESRSCCFKGECEDLASCQKFKRMH